MYRISKRCFDVVTALTLLVLLAPFAAVVMVLLRLTGEGKVFYRQERLGYQRKPFRILKFATMLEDSMNMPGGEITLDQDPRITPMGGFLRRTKINELPQLWNVLTGEMSVVGPRPLLKVSFEMYSPEVQKLVYESKPGLTGIGSLVFRDEASLVAKSGKDPRTYYRQVIYPHKGRLEIWYFENKSFFTDLKIVALTIFHLFFPSSTLAQNVFDGIPKLCDLGRPAARQS